ncbi:MAG TPA: hypothetical protein VFN38_15460 [Gemmatimonadaceae bacterium]|nr:hypothetical protein [Gemmatimonadaceae bacterium]
MRLLLIAVAFLPGCTSFANVRSARVRPGTTFDLQSSFASNPGDAAGWLLGNNLDCAERCGGGILGGELGVARGFVGHSLPFTLGGGVMGIVPYAEGYVQLAQGERPAGIGARFGVSPLTANPMGQVYARVDLPIAAGRHLLWNPALFHASGSTAAASASVTALVNGIGLESDSDETLTPSLAFVIARAQHDFPPVREGPGHAWFIVAGLRVAFGRHESARVPR